MEVKLDVREYKCWKNSYSEMLKKEECRDAVVPDTMPDIAAVLSAWGRVLIRSKDVSAGRISVEANVPVCVLCAGEDGSTFHVELSLPFTFYGEGDNIGDEAVATAKMELCSIEAKTLNPRKLSVRAELCAHLAAYERSSLCCAAERVDAELVYTRVAEEKLSLTQSVAEKSFALSDEISLPPGTDRRAEPLCIGVEGFVDDVKSVGTKLIVKGRVKSRLLMGSGEKLSHLEPETEFSQIIELGEEAGEGLSDVWLTPSGSYCSLSHEDEGRISLEYNIVAQIVTQREWVISYIDDAYSNKYSLEADREEICGEYFRTVGVIHENCRQLFECCRNPSEVLYTECSLGKERFEEGRMLLPYSFSAVCCGAEGIWCEKRRAELSLRLPSYEGRPLLLRSEVKGLSLLPVSGGLELRMEVQAHIACAGEKRFSCICAMNYDAENPKDLDTQPSLVLLRLSGGEELWDIARENCSEPDAILRANGIENLGQRRGELLLVPKIC